MKILVTGGSGRLGRFVIHELDTHGHVVHNLDRQRPGERLPAHHHTFDLTDAAAMYDMVAQIRPEAIVHLAANPAPFGFPRHAQFMENVGMLHAVLQIGTDFGVTRFAWASSEMANGFSTTYTCPPHLPFDETAMTVPPNDYALSKVVGEMIADSVIVRHPKVSIASLRINYVATEESFNWWRNADPNPHHNAANLWGYVEARDAASAFRLAIEHATPGHRRYMIAADDTTLRMPTRDAVREKFGPEIMVHPDLAEYGSPIDSGRARRDWGWQPVHGWRSPEKAEESSAPTNSHSA